MPDWDWFHGIHLPIKCNNSGYINDHDQLLLLKQQTLHHTRLLRLYIPHLPVGQLPLLRITQLHCGTSSWKHFVTWSTEHLPNHVLQDATVTEVRQLHLRIKSHKHFKVASIIQLYSCFLARHQIVRNVYCVFFFAAQT